MSESRSLDRARTLAELLEDSFQLYRAHVALLLVLAGGVALVVDGILAVGLGELTASYRGQSPAREQTITLIASGLVKTPLLAAMIAYVVLDLRASKAPSARRAAQAGLDVFAPLLLAVLLYVAVVAAGSLAFLLPGVWIAVLCFFVPQAVVVDGLRGTATLMRSAELVAGRWFRTLGRGLVFYAIVAVPGLGLTLAFDALARAAHAEALVVLGNVLYDTLALPLLGIGATLYYLELRENPRSGGAARSTR
ncbi:MAG: hypothetical protein ACR2ND_07325 [Solirubrobacteraceae bacterium]